MLSEGEKLLEKQNEKQSRQLSVIFFCAAVLCVFSIVVLTVTIFVPNTLGVDHKIYLSSVVGFGQLCVLAILIKSKNDSRSLFIWVFVSSTISGFIIGKCLLFFSLKEKFNPLLKGVCVGELTRKIIHQ